MPGEPDLRDMLERVQQNTEDLRAMLVRLDDVHEDRESLREMLQRVERLLRDLVDETKKLRNGE